MRTLVPCGDVTSIQTLAEAGADEFYIGFHDEEWERRFGTFGDINRMSGFGPAANRASFEDVLAACDGARAADRRLFVTLNANDYSTDQLAYIRDAYLPALASHGAAGVIVSGLELGQMAAEAGLAPVASTMCGIYNEDVAQVYRSAGFMRMIVPRELTVAEIAAVHQAVPDVELEAFFLRNGCLFSDGYCLGLHRPECGALCSFIRNRPVEVIGGDRGFGARHDLVLNGRLYDQFFHQLACGMCALWRLERAGVSSLKVVGRADRLDAVCDDVRLARQNLDILCTCSSEAEYLERMVFPRDADTRCLLGLSCYYPEVRFGA